MAKPTLPNPNTGLIKTAPLGFSWTTQLFGPLPALCRGDLKWFLIQAVLTPVVLPTLIFPFVYNRVYLQRMLEKGYKVQSTGGKSPHGEVMRGGSLPRKRNRPHASRLPPSADGHRDRLRSTRSGSVGSPH